jgi:hypothetical protein
VLSGRELAADHAATPGLVVGMIEGPVALQEMILRVMRWRKAT